MLTVLKYAFYPGSKSAKKIIKVKKVLELVYRAIKFTDKHCLGIVNVDSPSGDDDYNVDGSFKMGKVI